VQVEINPITDGSSIASPSSSALEFGGGEDHKKMGPPKRPQLGEMITALRYSWMFFSSPF
jgi:hypothetical protein